MNKFIYRILAMVSCVAVMLSTACDQNDGATDGPVVVATNASGYVVSDKGNLLLIRTDAAPSVAVGDVVSLTLGEPVAKDLVNGYDNVVANVVGKGTVTHPEPMVVDSAPDLASWLALRDPVYVEITGTLSCDSEGNWSIYNENLGGDMASATPYIQDMPEEWSLMDGAYVTVRGYYVSQYRFQLSEDTVGDTVYMYIMMTGIESAEAPRYHVWLEPEEIIVPADGSAVECRIYTRDITTPVPELIVDNSECFSARYVMVVDEETGEETDEISFGTSLESGVSGWAVLVSAKPNTEDKVQKGNLTIRIKYEETEGGPLKTIDFNCPLRQEEYIGGTTTLITLADHMPSVKTIFEETGSVYSIEGLDLTFYNNSTKFGWYVSALSNGNKWLGIKADDVIKIDGKGKTIRKVEIGGYDESNASARNLTASDGSNLSLVMENVVSGTKIDPETHETITTYKTTYFNTWSGKVPAISFTANKDYSYYVIRVTYTE